MADGRLWRPAVNHPRRLLPLLTLAVASLLMPGPAAAAGEPAGYEHFHTYAEVKAGIDAAVAGHPDIARSLSIGESYQGRQIWAVKISDNVAVDEDEPEVFINAQIHARERISNEMAMYLIDLLTSGYGDNQRLTDIVDSREIWIVPTVNPDGAEYDMSDGIFRKWRKNRQPIPGSDAIGVDLNRQFGFTWACCGGSSNKPSSDYYRGPSAWIAPEARAYRDFVESRVVKGRQQIRAILSLHAAGRQVLWPYAYTRTDVPRTMTRDDHRAFVALARQMAELNGYRAEQGSDLYIVDGDQDDWAYHDQRIFALTIEMAAGSRIRQYPSASEVAADLERNRPAVLLLLEQADCPYRLAGLGATRCGPLNDDFEISRGWTFSPDDGTGWERARPRYSATSAGVKQRGVAASGQAALVTGAARGAGAAANDVDGVTTTDSPTVELGTGAWTVSFRYTFAHNSSATSADYLRLSVVDGATTTALWTLNGSPTERNARWRTSTADLSAWAGKTIRLQFEAVDGGSDNIVEAVVDNVRVYQAP